jgi:hypothetical protein
VTSAIEEVSRASEARLSALSQYLQAASAKAKDDAEAVKRLLAGREAIASEMSAQRAEAQLERAGIETQLADLGLSAKQRATLEDAQKTLAGLAAMLQQRAGQTEERSTQADKLAGLLRELDGAYQARQTALASEAISLASETQRWGVYYTARLARARIECAVIQPAAPAQRKKQ